MQAIIFSTCLEFVSESFIVCARAMLAARLENETENGNEIKLQKRLLNWGSPCSFKEVSLLLPLSCTVFWFE